MKNNWDKIKNLTSGLRGLATIGISDIAGNGISAIFWFYLASILGAKNYGEISYFIAIASISSTISLIGSQNTLTVYTAKNIRIEPPVFLISIIAGIVTSVSLFAIYDNLGLSLLSFGYVIFGLGSSEILGKKLYTSYSVLLITQRLLMISLSIGLFYVMGSQGVIYGLALAFLPYAIRIYKGFCGAKIDFSLIKSRVGFMANSYIFNLAAAFNGSIDKIILAPMLGYTILGNYQLGIQFLAILQMLPSIVYKYTLPQDASGIPNKKLKQITVLGSICLAVLGFFISPLLIPALFPKYTDAIIVIQITSLSLIPTSINFIYQSKFVGNEKMRTVLIVSGIYLIVQIISIVILGKLFGITGVSVAFVISQTVEMFVYFFISKFSK